uniref:Uncharacterized protein n=1 Tax=Arundo donax TaxID=35708 RepID=A0A0A8YJ81_ARUDO
MESSLCSMRGYSGGAATAAHG